MTSTRSAGGGTGAQTATAGPLTETFGGVTVQADTPIATVSIITAEMEFPFI